MLWEPMTGCVSRFVMKCRYKILNMIHCVAVVNHVKICSIVMGVLVSLWSEFDQFFRVQVLQKYRTHMLDNNI